jgi:hypothetical protein
MRRLAPSLVPLVVTLAACAPDTQIGDRPDARPGTDAALVGDGGGRDGGLDAPAPLNAPEAIDAAEPLDVSSPDAPAPLDAWAATDAGPDARVGTDAGGDAGPAPRDAGPVLTIDFCRVQYPTTMSVAPGTSTRVYGRVYVAGLTTRTGMTDTDPRVVGQVGYGPDGTMPSAMSWTWSSNAVSNAGYGPGAALYEANNDEYQADLVAPAAGSYDFAYRFSGDGGMTWTYCDTLDPGSSDGYQIANAGALTVM